MPNRVITSQDVLRYIHRSTDDKQFVPQLASLEGGYVDLYKGEIAVNYSRDNPGLFLRIGSGTEESNLTDKLIRIGNVVVGDVEPFVEQPDVDREGLTWYDTSRGHFFLYVEDEFKQLTNGAATELLAGVVRQATYAETILGFEEASYVSPKNLKSWQEYYEFVSRKRNSSLVYVDGHNGDDSIENDGSDLRFPFLTLERALLEVSRRQVNTVKLMPGEYLVDNGVGATELDSIVPPLYKDADDKPIGPVNGVLLSGVLLEVDPIGDKGAFVIEDVGVEGLYRNQQVFFEKDGVLLGHALLDTLEDQVTVNPIPYRNLRGTVEVGARIRVAKLSSLNSPTGGLIISKACTIRAEGSAVLRPKHVNHYDHDEAVNRTYLLKVTHSCCLDGLVFKDGLGRFNQFAYSAVTNATLEDLRGGDVNYFYKGSRAVGSLDINNPEYFVRERAAWLQIRDCVLDSHYGASLLTLDASFYGELKEIIISNFIGVVTQEDPTAYVQEEALGEPTAEQVLLTELRNWVVRVDGGDYFVMFNGGYTRYVPQFFVVAEGNATTVNVGNHLYFDDPHPQVLFNLDA